MIVRQSGLYDYVRFLRSITFAFKLLSLLPMFVFELYNAIFLFLGTEVTEWGMVQVHVDH